MSQSEVDESVHKTELHRGHHYETRKGVGMSRESSSVPVCVSPVNKKRKEKRKKGKEKRRSDGEKERRRGGEERRERRRGRGREERRWRGEEEEEKRKERGDRDFTPECPDGASLSSEGSKETHVSLVRVQQRERNLSGIEGPNSTALYTQASARDTARIAMNSSSEGSHSPLVAICNANVSGSGKVARQAWAKCETVTRHADRRTKH